MAKQLNVNLAFTADAQQAKAQIQSLQTALNQIVQAPVNINTGSMTKGLQEASLAASQLKNHIQAAVNIDTGTLDFAKLNASLQKSGISLSDYAAKIAAIGPTGQQAVSQLALAINQSEIPIRRVNGALQNMMVTLKNTARWQLSSSMIHGFVGAIQSAYGYAQNLNKALTDISIVADKNTFSMSKFAEQANAAAKALNTTTVEYAKASLIFYQQGLPEEQIAERAALTTKMANVTGQNMQIVSDQLTAIWNNFDDGSKSLEYYVDVITALGAATASSTDEISQGLEKFAAIAETVGLSYEYATAALATVTAETRQSAEVVGTAFKTLFARIQDLELGETLDDGTTLGKYSAALNTVGINIKDANGEIKEMDTILSELGNKWSTLSKDTQVALAQTVAGTRQYTQLIALMDNWGTFQENLNTAYNSSGTLQEQADEYAKSWEAAQKRVKAALEGVYSNLIKDDFFIGLLNTLEDIIGFVDKLIDSLGGLGGVLSTVSVILMRTFSDQMAQKLRDMAYNLQMSTSFGRQKMAEKKDQQAAEIGHILSAGAGGEGSLVGSEIAKQYDEQRRMQQELAANQEHMSQEEIAAAQQILDIRRQIGDEIIKARQTQEEGRQQTSDGYEGALAQLGQYALDADEFEIDEEILTEFEGYKNQVKEAETALVNLEDATSRYQKAQQNLTQTMNNSNASAEDQERAAKEVVDAYENLHNVVSKTAEVNNGASISAEQAEGVFQKLVQRLDDTDVQADEASQAMAGLTGTLRGLSESGQQNLTQGLSIDKGNVDNMVNGWRKIAHGANEAAAGTRNAEDAQRLYEQRLKESKAIMSDWATRTVAFGQGLMSFVSVINSAKGAIDTLTNPDASGWEKFSAVLMSFGSIVLMVSTMVTSFKKALSGLTIAKLKDKLATIAGTAAEVLDAAAVKLNEKARRAKENATKGASNATKKDTQENIKHAASEMADKAATDANNGSKKNLGQSMKSLGKSFGNLLKSAKSWIGGVGLIAAGVAVAVGAIAWGINQFNKYENAAKEAAKQAEEAATAYQSVSEAYSTFTNNLDNYKNAQDGLKGLTRGTDEYREAVLQANEAAMELLNTYDNLTYEIDADGLIKIDESSLAEAKQQQLDALENAQRASRLMNQEAKKAKLKSDTVNFQREELHSSQGSATQAGNVAAATGAGAASGALIGAGIGTIVPVIGNAVGAAVGAVVGTAVGAITGVVGSIKAGAAAKEEQAALDKLAKVYAEEGNAKFATDEAFEKLLREELKIDDEALIQSLRANRDATKDLVAEMAKINGENVSANADLLLSEYGDNIMQDGEMTSGEARQIAQVVATPMQEQIDKLYDEKYEDQFAGMTDADIQKMYAEKMNWSTDTIENQSGNKAKYYDKNGKEVGVISDEVARKFLAQQAALEEFGPVLDTVSNKFKELSSSTDQASQAMADFLLNRDFDTMSKEEYDALVATVQGEDGVIDETEAKEYLEKTYANGGKLEDVASAYGFESADKWVETFMNNVANYDSNRADATSDFSDTTLQYLSQLDQSKLSTQDLKSIGQIFQNNLKKGNGAEIAENFVNVLNKAGGEAGTIITALNGVDWSTATAETLTATLKEAGVTTAFTAEELDQLVSAMNNTVTTFEGTSQKLQALDKASDINWGETLSADQFNQLSASAQSYFTLMADGSYKLIGDAQEFYDLVSNEKKETLRHNVESNVAQLDKNMAPLLSGYSKDQIFTTKGAELLGGYDSLFYTMYASNFKQYGFELVNSTENDGTRKLIPTTDSSFMFNPEETDASGKTTYSGFVYQKDGKGGYEQRKGNLHVIDEEADYKHDYETRSGTASYDNQKQAQIWLKYLKTTSWYEDASKEDKEKFDKWDKKINTYSVGNPFTVGDYSDMKAIVEGTLEEYNANAAAVAEYQKEITKNTFEYISQGQTVAEREALYNEQYALATTDESRSAITQGYSLAANAAIQEEKWEGMDVSEVNDYADALLKAAKNSELLDDNMSEEAAEEVALYTKKMNKGVEKLSAGFEEWHSILDDGSDEASEEYVTAMADMKDAMSDVLGVEEEFLTDDFILKNMEDIEKAAKGDAEAIDRLAIAAGQEILINMSMNDESLQTELLGLQDTLLNKIPDDIKVGATLDTSDFGTAAQDLIDTAGMSVEEAQAYFNSLGYEPEFVMENKTETAPMYGKRVYTDDVVMGEADDGTKYVKEMTTREEQVYMGEHEQNFVVPVLSGDGTPQIKSLTKKSSGAMNNKSSTNKGGKSGGGGGGNTKKTSESRKKKSDVVDRYKEVSDKLDDTANAMNKASKAADGLYGVARIKNMEKVNSLLTKEIKLLGEKRKEAKGYLKEDQDALRDKAKEAGYELTFDKKTGNITNYTDVLNELYKDREQLLDSFGKTIDDDEQKKLEALDEKIDNLKDAAADYEETLAVLAELDQQEIDKFNEILSNNFETLNAKIELDIEFNERDLAYLEYQLSKVESDVYAQREAASYSKDQLTSYKDNLSTYADAYKSLNKAYADGEISQASYVEGMKSVADGLMENLSSVRELDQAMQDYYGNTLSMAQEEISKYTDLMEHSTTVLDHYQNLMGLFGQSTDYEMMGKILNAKATVSKDAYDVSAKNYDMLKKQADDAKTAYDAAVQAGKTGVELDILEQQWFDAQNAANEAQDQMLSDAAEWAENMRAVLENSLAGFAQQLEDALTGDFGSFDALSTEMERASSLQEEYLTTTNKIYETNKMMRTAQKEIDKTTNQMAKRKLKEFITETAAMQEQGKLSQYELEIQQAKYDLLLAEIALKEAQNAKSTVRLQRDSEGNFGYVYTADQSAIDDAQQKFEDSQNALYNKGLEGANDYAQKYTETMSEMNDALAEANQKYLDGEYKDVNEYNDAIDKIREYYYQKLEDYSSLYQVAIGTDGRVTQDAWSSAFGAMTTQTEQWKTKTEEYIGQSKDAFEKFNLALKPMKDSLSGSALSIQQITQESNKLKTALTKEGGVIESLGSVLDSVKGVTAEYITQRKELEKLIGTYEGYITAANNHAKTAAFDENAIAAGSEIAIKKTATWATGVGQDEDFSDKTKAIDTSKGYTILRWDQGKNHFLISDGAGNYGWVKKSDLVGFDSGGYTGEWGSYGKMAMLHEKEMVLNQNDTENFLASMEFLHKILEVIDLQAMSSQLGGILSSPNLTNSNSSVIEQSVHIEANFPNATNHSEIEEAFNNLINTASQYANRK